MFHEIKVRRTTAEESRIAGKTFRLRAIGTRDSVNKIGIFFMKKMLLQHTLYGKQTIMAGSKALTVWEKD